MEILIVVGKELIIIILLENRPLFWIRSENWSRASLSERALKWNDGLINNKPVHANFIFFKTFK
jgi:hypothetical protein